MIEIEINGKKITAEKDRTILETALENNIDIPHLCFHKALEPYGACRVCIVEIERHNRKQLTTACTYPIRDSLKVFTNTEKVKKVRQFTIRLLLMLAPESEKIKDLAIKYHVDHPFQIQHDDLQCVRCGLCIRVCKEIIGKEAIGFINRGIKRIPETPFLEENSFCISCGACAYVCPTGKIEIVDQNNNRLIGVWHKQDKLVNCEKCGKTFTSTSQLEEVKQRIKNPDLASLLILCPECRKKEIIIKINKNKIE